MKGVLSELVALFSLVRHAGAGGVAGALPLAAKARGVNKGLRGEAVKTSGKEACVISRLTRKCQHVWVSLPELRFRQLKHPNGFGSQQGHALSLTTTTATAKLCGSWNTRSFKTTGSVVHSLACPKPSVFLILV